MNLSSSSSGKSEARRPFIKSPAPQTPADGQLKRKLDFDVNLLLTAPLMKSGGSKPSKSKTYLHLRDQSITQPLDGSKKKMDVVDLIGSSEDKRKGGVAFHNPSKFLFPTHVIPPPPLIGRRVKADILGPSSGNPASDVNLYIMNQAMQVRIDQLEAEVTRLSQIIMVIPGSTVANIPAFKSPVPAKSPASDTFDVWFSSPDAPNSLLKVPVPTLAEEGVMRDSFRPILDKCELMMDHVSFNLSYCTMPQF